MNHQSPTALSHDLLHDDEMQRALAEHDFGAVFRIARQRAGISYSKIAAECDIKPERVGTLARGQGRITTFEKVVQIVDALRVPGCMVGLASRPWEADGTPAGPSHAENGLHVRRRTILQAATSVGLAAALPALQRPDAPRRVTTACIDRLCARTARLRRLDDVLGGGDTFRVYLAEFQFTKGLLQRASFTDDSRRRLTALLAEQAQQAGWAAFDGGRTHDATSLYEESHILAQDAQDPDLHGNSLAFLAYRALPDDRHTAVEFAQDSCATITDRTPSTVRALLYERLAWARAVNGQATETETALQSAREALADETQAGEPQPDWSVWVDHTELDIMTGRCWTELHRPLRAVPVLTEALRQYSDNHARDKALYLSWLADAYLTAGEVEQAAETVSRALELGTGVASIRPQQRIAPLLDRLRSHRNLSPVRDLLERAAG